MGKRMGKTLNASGETGEEAAGSFGGRDTHLLFACRTFCSRKAVRIKGRVQRNIYAIHNAVTLYTPSSLAPPTTQENSSLTIPLLLLLLLPLLLLSFSHPSHFIIPKTLTYSSSPSHNSPPARPSLSRFSLSFSPKREGKKKNTTSHDVPHIP